MSKKKPPPRPLILSVGNPELARAMRDKAQSGAAGVHDTRPKGYRDRRNTRRNTIADQGSDH